MALQTSIESLQTAWRALGDQSHSDGWRMIAVELKAPCQLMAGRHFPGEEEAILVGFRDVKMPPESQLPQGHGFTVGKLLSHPAGGTRSWIVLSRRLAGSRELFALMAADLIGMFESFGGTGQVGLFNLFLSRIRAWQDFMKRDLDDVLSMDAEVGLSGELAVLKDLLNLGIPASVVLESWQGPLDNIHDFVSSLEQLDETLRQPLFVAGVRLVLANSGQTLPEFVADIRGYLQAEPVAAGIFESRLVHAGYLSAMSSKYVRRFSHSGTSFLPVEGDFPRLTRLHVSADIKQARYELDLDNANVNKIGLTAALARLGVL